MTCAQNCVNCFLLTHREDCSSNICLPIRSWTLLWNSSSKIIYFYVLLLMQRDRCFMKTSDLIAAGNTQKLSMLEGSPYINVFKTYKIGWTNEQQKLPENIRRWGERAEREKEEKQRNLLNEMRFWWINWNLIILNFLNWICFFLHACGLFSVFLSPLGLLALLDSSVRILSLHSAEWCWPSVKSNFAQALHQSGWIK